MAEIDVIHRRSLAWAWWLAGAVLLGLLLWLGTTFLTADAADGDSELEPYFDPETVQTEPANLGEM